MKGLLLGFYGRGNFGDDLMLAGLVNYLRSNGMETISVISGIEGVVPDDCIYIRRTKISILKAIFNSSYLIQGGGTIFHDSYVGLAKYKYFLNLGLFALIFLIARCLRKKVWIVGAGIGPLNSKIAKLLSSISLNLVNGIIVRDEASYIDALGLLPNSKKLFRSHDLAFLADLSHLNSSVDDKIFRYGISICDVSDFFDDSLGEPWTYLAKTINNMPELFDRLDVELCFISLFDGDSSLSDEIISRKLVQKLKVKCKIRFVTYTGSINLFIREVININFFLATKFHACILAMCLKKPFVALAYNRKVRDLSAEFSLPMNQVYDLDALCIEMVWRDIFHNSFNGRYSVISSQLLDTNKMKLDMYESLIKDIKR
jgi:polysaccharide pyruvyl transferase WcaK-like protein